MSDCLHCDILDMLEDYVEHLRSRGLEIETISGVGLDAGAIAAF
jgi:hypothetical protein